MRTKSKEDRAHRPRALRGRHATVVTALSMLALAPAGASAIVVPDEAPTIQAGIDSGAEEVLIRPGFYPETPVIDRFMTVRGLRSEGSDEIPEMMGLTLDDGRQGSSHSASLTITGLHFRGPVKNVFHLAAFSGEYTLAFADCVMDSGVTDETEAALGQVLWSIRGCRIAGGVTLTKPFGISLQNNTIHGSVQAATHIYDLLINRNLIEGKGPFGIDGRSEEQQVLTVDGNTVRGFDVGISVAGPGSTVTNNLVEDCARTGILIDDPTGWSDWVSDNTVRSCGSAISANGDEVVLVGNFAEDCGSGILAAARVVRVTGNRVSRCGTGLIAEGSDDRPDLDAVVSRDNVVERCKGGLALSSLGDCVASRDTVIDCAAGIRLRSQNSSAVIDSAVVLSCGGPGIRIEGLRASTTRCVVGRCVSEGIQVSAASAAMVAGNTTFLNGGSGFVVGSAGSPTGTVAANIGFGNQGHGLSVDPGAALALSCNDWYRNAAGATEGLPPGPTDLAVDPWFCNDHVNDVHLAPGSLLADVQGCGLIGALGPGCSDSATPTLVALFEAERVAGGVLVRWRLARSGTVVSVERAPAAGGPWASIATHSSDAGEEGTELDAGAPEQQTCWYRLMALEGGALRVIAGPIEVGGAPGRFALARVGPIPANGPMELELTVPRDATIELTVLDVQGRTVARLAGGEWTAGLRAIRWNGEGPRGLLPPGLYLIRYRFPGGQESRPIVISR